MKKILLVLGILTTLIVLIMIYINENITSPKSRLKQQFNLELKDGQFSIANEREQWSPNGNGFYYVEINLINDFSIIKEIQSKFKPLPVKEDFPGNSVIGNVNNFQDGYYSIGTIETDPTTFKIALYDSKKKKIILYYEVL
ncbi:hypothetical protein [Arcticibacter tournemirensis]